MQRLYFDYNATTPVSPSVLDEMLPAMLEEYGNPSSIHQFGQRAKQRLELARKRTAALLGCDAAEVVFVSGGTESNNLALFGAVNASSAAHKHVITTAIEHPAVLNACAQLEREGVAVSRVPVGRHGIVDPDDVRNALRPETVLISVMHANNEIGTVQPVEEIAAIAREAGVLLHSDGVQAAGKIPLDMKQLGVDLYSISGHKIYAPKGIGALYVRKGVHLQPMLYGGRHERERRAGTENVPGAIALGRACADAVDNLTAEAVRIAELRDRLEQGTLARVPDASINGRGRRVPNTCNITFGGIEGESLLIALDLKGFAVSSGAACSSGAVAPSHVLLAIGLSKEEARATLRFSLGRSTTAAHVDALVDAVADAYSRLRHRSPAYAGANV